MGRYLAVDLGEKRVGLALSDPMGIIASPYKVIPFTGAKKIFEELMNVVREKEVEKVIIGLPVREDGLEGPGCEASRALARRFYGNGIPVELWDERYTSVTAEQMLREAGVKARKMRGRLDEVAASLLLEDWLKARNC